MADLNSSARTTSFKPTPEQAHFRWDRPPTPPASSPSPPAPTEAPPPPDSPKPSPAASSSPSSPPPPPSAESIPDTGPDTTSFDPNLLRTCRICFDTSAPPYEPDPELGALISPCTCNGSSRYVHRGCLQRWRQTSSTASYRCPTCHYKYQLQRLTLAAILSSTMLRLLVSSSVVLAIVWLLGYLSEPLLARNLGLVLDVDDLDLNLGGGWTEHLLRGTASLGCIGFLKVIYFLGPGSYWNLRNLSSRERTNRIGWFVVAIGVLNFFWWVWKAVGGWVERRLGKAAGDVLEVGERDEIVLGFWEEIWGWVVDAWIWVQRMMRGGGVGDEAGGRRR